MSDVARIRSIKAGLHASATNFSTFPASTSPIQVIGAPPSLFPRFREQAEFDVSTVDGRGMRARWLGRNLAPIQLPMEMKGVNSNGGGAVADWEAKMEMGALLASFFGAVAPATTGAATTCSGTAGATLTVADGTNIPNNSVILFATSTGVFLRRVISGGGTTTLTLDRAASGTASGTVYRGAAYSMVPGRIAHTHIGLDVEGTTTGGASWRTKFTGCGPDSMEISVPETGIVQAVFGFTPTTWVDDTPASPSYADPTAGGPIPANATKFYLGGIGAELDVAGLKVTARNGLVPRPSAAGPDGVNGYVCSNKREVMVEATLYIGGGTLSSELTVAQAQALLGSDVNAGGIIGTQALAIACGAPSAGAAPGTSMGIWMPEANVTGAIEEAGGLTVLKLRAQARGATPLVVGFY